jgi:hypothetical protein
MTIGLNEDFRKYLLHSSGANNGYRYTLRLDGLTICNPEPAGLTTYDELDIPNLVAGITLRDGYFPAPRVPMFSPRQSPPMKRYVRIRGEYAVFRKHRVNYIELSDGCYIKFSYEAMCPHKPDWTCLEECFAKMFVIESDGTIIDFDMNQRKPVAYYEGLLEAPVQLSFSEITELGGQIEEVLKRVS